MLRNLVPEAYLAEGIVNKSESEQFALRVRPLALSAENF
jgi:hypothetical protein